MKKLILILTTLLLLGTAMRAPAATHTTSHFAATFVETRTLAGFDQPIVSHGKMQFQAAGTFRWEITRPYHYLFELHNGQASETLPDGTVRRLDPDKTPWLKAVERIFVSALSGDQAQLKQYFKIDIRALPNNAGRHVTLIPKTGAMAEVIKQIDVIETAPGHPQHLQIKEVSGGTMDIRFTPITPARDRE